VDQLAALAPEIIVAVAYGQILRPEVLDIPPRGVLNIHPSLLPRWRGASPIPAAILAGDEQTGATIMLMDAGMDSGPILAQRPITIQPADTAETISEQLSNLGADLLAETLPRWLASEIRPAAQDETMATKSALLRKEDGAIDWSMPAIDVWRRVRAYNPWPGAYTSLDNDLIHIWQAWPLEGDSGAEPGAVLPLQPDQRGDLPEDVEVDAIAVQTGSGLLAILRLQRAGRRAMPAGEFLRGMPGLVGRRLHSD
jgi:methionyl-tRNA formyltransferase